MKELVLTEELPASLAKQNLHHITYPVLDQLEAFICIYDIKRQKPDWINEYTNSKLGYSVEELAYLGMDQFFEFYSSGMNSVTNRLNKLVTNNNSLGRGIIRIRTKGNNWIWAIGTACFFADSESKTEYVLTFATEIDTSDIFDM